MEILLKSIRSIAFIILGIVALTFSNEINDQRLGDYISTSIYGGDAYTGIQNAAADTGNNVYKQSQIVQQGFSYTFILVGWSLLIIGITTIPCMRKNHTCMVQQAHQEPQNENNPSDVQESTDLS